VGFSSVRGSERGGGWLFVGQRYLACVFLVGGGKAAVFFVGEEKRERRGSCIPSYLRRKKGGLGFHRGKRFTLAEHKEGNSVQPLARGGEGKWTRF